MPTYYGESAFLNLPAQPVQGGDPHFNNVALQLPLRAHLRDESKSPKVMTVGGAPVASLGGTYFGGSARLYTPSTAVLHNPFTTDYTIEAYVRASSWSSWSHLADGVQHGHMYANSDLNNTHWWSFGPRTDGKLSVFYYGPGEKVSTRTLLTNTWHHVAMVTDKKANVLRLFIDGQQDSTHAIPSCGNSTYISVAYAQNGYLTGYIRDLRVTPGVARYTSSFTPPLALPAPHGVAKLSRRVPLALPEAKRPPLITRTPSAAHRPQALRRGRTLNQDLRLTSFVDFTDGVDLVRGEASVLSGGSVRKVSNAGYCTEHDAADDRTQIAADSRDIIPTDGNITIFAHIYPWGASSGYAHCFGVADLTGTANNQYRCGAHLPYTDGNIYWDYGGAIAGSTRLSVAMPASSHRSVYAFTCGPRGMEIWHNGTRIASNSSTPIRTELNVAFKLGVHGGVTADASWDSNRFNCYAFGISRRQLPYGLLQKLTRSPEDMWEVVVPGRAVLPTYMKSESRRAPVLARRQTQRVDDPLFTHVRAQLPLRHSIAEERANRALTVSGVTLANGGGYFGAASAGYILISSPTVSDVSWRSFPYTIEAEIYLPAAPSGTGITAPAILSNSTSGTNYWAFGVNANRTLNLYYWTGFQNNLAGTLLVPLQRWVRVAFAHDGAGRATFYVDDKPDANTAVGVGQYSTGTPFRVGANGYATAVPYIRNLRVTSGVPRLRSAIRPLLSTPSPARSFAAPALGTAPAAPAVISGTCAALDTDDVSAVTAILRSTGVLTATDDVDLSTIAAALYGLIATDGGDVAALAGKLGTAASMSAIETADLASAIGKIATLGTLAATELSGDEWYAIGRSWPGVYTVTTGLILSSPASILALSEALTTIGSFPPVVVSDVTLPDAASDLTLP